MPKGRLRKPRIEVTTTNGHRVERVLSIAIQEDGKQDTDLVFARREDLRFNPDDLRCGSAEYLRRPPRVVFQLDPDNAKRAFDVRFVEMVEQ